MDKQGFVTKYLPVAQKITQSHGIPSLFALAQSALETGWGKHTPQHMMFGMKVGSGKSFGGWNGKAQLLKTTEYHPHDQAFYPMIEAGYPKLEARGRWKYRVTEPFRAYESPEHAFRDWAGLLTSQPRYQKALVHRDAPYQFAQAVVEAGYATDPLYPSKIAQLMREVETMAPETTLPEPAWWVLILALLTMAAGFWLSAAAKDRRALYLLEDELV